MTWRMAGTYVASCSCDLLCPCPVDGRPNSANGECRGVACFQIREGNLDDVDLSGVSWAFVNYFPSNLTAGNWHVGVVVDETASDQQVEALGKITSGEAGGPFAEFAPLISENLGMGRAKVGVSDAGGSISGMSEFSYEQLRGADGSPTQTENAMFAFASPFRVGRTSGHTDALGVSFDGNYGEWAEYEYSSEAHDVHARA